MEGNGKENRGRRDGREAAVMLKVFFLLCVSILLPFSLSFAGGCGCGDDDPLFEQEESSVPVPETVTTSRKSKIITHAARDSATRLHAEKIASIPVEVHPEKTVWLELSNTDLNRVVCSNGEITDVLYSQEKGIRVKTAGSDAYIKFMMQEPQTPDERPERVTVPSEFYLVCAGETFSFIGKPEPVPSKTIYLVSERAGIEEGKESFRSDPVDEAITKIIRTIFLDTVPPSWNQQRDSGFRRLVLPTSRGTLDLQEIGGWHIPGTGVTAHLFHVQEIERQEMQVMERDLLFPEITTNPIAISIEDNLLSPKMPATRAVILERLSDTGV